MKRWSICWLLMIALCSGFWVNLQGEDVNGASTDYRYRCALPKNELGYWIVSKQYLEDLDPSGQPDLFASQELRLFATPGEYEPATFVIYAVESLQKIAVEVSSLRHEKQVLDRRNLTLRTVLRSPERLVYWGPPEESVLTSRILPAYRPFDLKAGEFRELWLTVRVPPDLSPGRYQGIVSVSPANRPVSTLKLSVQVLPFQLRRNPEKRFGVHYSVSNLRGNRSKVLLELEDMKAHGADFVFSTSRIDYEGVEGDKKPNFDELKAFLSLMKQSGFEDGPISVETGFEELALEWSGRSKSELEKDPELYAALARELEAKKPFHALAEEALEGLEKIREEYPSYDFYLTHMDEVFNRGRLPLYIALTNIVRELSNFQMHMSIHHGEGTESMRQEIDPYIDLRVHHGYTFEQWLTRGHSIEEYRQELERSGDLSWQYHNRIGAFITPKWQRLINGLYMWLAPFQGRYDWTYQHYYGDPFNDLDGRQGLRYDDNSWAFPSPEDGITPVPTRAWEAWREGIDDLSYLYTLEEMIREAQDRGESEEVESAQQWLDSVAGWFPDPDQLTSGKRGTPEESPVIYAMAQQISVGSLQRMRHTTAMYVQQLNLLGR